MYTPSNRPLPCAVAAIFVAAMLTVATVGPAYAGTGKDPRCGSSQASAQRPILA